MFTIIKWLQEFTLSVFKGMKKKRKVHPWFSLRGDLAKGVAPSLNGCVKRCRGGFTPASRYFNDRWYDDVKSPRASLSLSRSRLSPASAGVKVRAPFKSGQLGVAASLAGRGRVC
jgi:hypothetical protein